MASIVVAGDTSGTITLSAPAVAGTNTLTLPTQTATLATLTTPSFASTIGVGGATAAASGAGITFPATQSASSDANTLDDYEEGTWTPTGNGITFSSAVGKYTKIGNAVTVWWTVAFPTTSSSVAAQIGGLPFTVGSDIYCGAMGITNVGIADVLVFAHSGQTNIFHRNSGNNDYSNAQFSGSISYGFSTYKVD